jgi:hypothetical protein
MRPAKGLSPFSTGWPLAASSVLTAKGAKKHKAIKKAFLRVLSVLRGSSSFDLPLTLENAFHCMTHTQGREMKSISPKPSAAAFFRVLRRLPPKCIGNVGNLAGHN